MRTNLSKIARVALYALVALSIFYGIRNAAAQRQNPQSPNRVGSSQVDGLSTPTPTPSPTVSPSPSVSPTPTATPEINGSGSIASPNGGSARFVIFDVEDEQITSQFLEGFFAYFDPASHIKFGTGKILTATFNGDQAAFTGTATIGKKKQPVDFTVSVMGNQTSPNADTFTISLSNGYSAGGVLKKGSIQVGQGDD